MATTADYLNKLVTQKNTLADNLVTKGVDATHDETLETLVPKVLNISGERTTIDGDLSYSHYLEQQQQIMLGFINSGAKFNGSSDWEKDRLAITKNFSSYSIIYSCSMDFTNIKKIIVNGAITSNLSGLTASAYCKVSPNIETALNTDEWIVLSTTVPASAYELLDFSTEIDCVSITGENYINLAILHGTESSSYTSYLYLDSIEFIYG